MYNIYTHESHKCNLQLHLQFAKYTREYLQNYLPKNLCVKLVVSFFLYHVYKIKIYLYTVTIKVSAKWLGIPIGRLGFQIPAVTTENFFSRNFLK